MAPKLRRFCYRCTMKLEDILGNKLQVLTVGEVCSNYFKYYFSSA